MSDNFQGVPGMNYGLGGLNKFNNPLIPGYGNVIPDNSYYNTSQQGLNNSMPNLGMGNPSMNFGLGLLGNMGITNNTGFNMGGVQNNLGGIPNNMGVIQNNIGGIPNNFGGLGTQYAMPFGMNTQRIQTPNALTNQFGMSALYPQNYPQYGTNYLTNNQFGQQSLSQSLIAQMNQMNYEELLRIQMEEEAAKKAKEDEKEFMKNFEEELHKMLQEKRSFRSELVKPIDIYLQKSEYFYERDRYFFEELIQQPLKTEGFLGTGDGKNFRQISTF